jgi:hypothetical protein
MVGEDVPRTKAGKGSVKNKAPTNSELEFWAGKMMTPAPGMSSLPQEEIATLNQHHTPSVLYGESMVRVPLTVWVSKSIRDNERNVVWLTVLTFGSRWRSGIKVQRGGAWRLTHDWTSRKSGRP